MYMYNAMHVQYRACLAVAVRATPRKKRRARIARGRRPWIEDVQKPM